MHSWAKFNSGENDSNGSYDERVSDLIPSTCAGGREAVGEKDTTIYSDPFLTPPRHLRQTLKETQNIPNSSRRRQERNPVIDPYKQLLVDKPNSKMIGDRKSTQTPDSLDSVDYDMLLHERRLKQLPRLGNAIGRLQKNTDIIYNENVIRPKDAKLIDDFYKCFEKRFPTDARVRLIESPKMPEQKEKSKQKYSKKSDTSEDSDDQFFTLGRHNKNATICCLNVAHGDGTTNITNYYSYPKKPHQKSKTHSDDQMFGDSMTSALSKCEKKKDVDKYGSTSKFQLSNESSSSKSSANKHNVDYNKYSKKELYEMVRKLECQLQSVQTDHTELKIKHDKVLDAFSKQTDKLEKLQRRFDIIQQQCRADSPEEVEVQRDESPSFYENQECDSDFVNLIEDEPILISILKKSPSRKKSSNRVKWSNECLD